MSTTEEIANSMIDTTRSVEKEVKSSTVHPAVGVIGVGTIGAALGAIAAGPLGAILGASIGAATASRQNIKLGKSSPSYEMNEQSSMMMPEFLSTVKGSMQNLRKEVAEDITGLEEMDQSSSSKTQTIRGVLLDIDGTLVISNDAHAQGYVEGFVEYGYPITFEQVRPLIGMGSDQVIPQLVPELSGEEGVGKEIANKRKQSIIEKFGATLPPAPGSRELIQRLKQDGFQLVVASSATTEELGVLLKAAQVDDLLEPFPVTTSSDADSSKPAPDIVQVALEKGQLQPQEAIMLGDTPYDIESAGKAGVSVIAFRCGGFDDSQLNGAIAIYNDPADLLAHYDESPLGRRQISSVTAS